MEKALLVGPCALVSCVYLNDCPSTPLLDGEPTIHYMMWWTPPHPLGYPTRVDRPSRRPTARQGVCT